MLAGLLLLPVLELVVAINLGRRLGALPVLTALLLLAIAGILLVRRQGAAAWHCLNRSVRTGEPLSRELADATILLLAGILLIAPGFLTDALALALIFSPTRQLARRPLERTFLRATADRITLLEAFGPDRRTGTGTTTDGPAGTTGRPPTGPHQRPRFGGDVVEGEIVEGDPPQK